MQNSLINIRSINNDGTETSIEATVNQYASLMELLVDNDYPVLATCGGMALCGTCCIDILSTTHALPDPEDDEISMLDSLPHSTQDSRLSCQLKISAKVDGIIFRLNAQE